MTGLTNAMTIDVEDYFQVQAFADRIRRDDWTAFECRIERNTDAILEMLAARAQHATFFTLGWVAERYPAMVRRIVAGGHELASHGFEHIRVDQQSPAEFRQDVRRSRSLLEDVGGVPVGGYRAASFSIGESTWWAFKILAEEGYRYSSSLYPIRHDLYGVPHAPRFPFRPQGADGVLECPVSTVSVMGRNLPCGGGGYFRLLPYAVSRRQLRWVNCREKRPCVFYFHPWEIDPQQPRQDGITWRTRIRHYTNLDRMASRLAAILDEFAWDRMDRVFAPALAEAA